MKPVFYKTIKTLLISAIGIIIVIASSNVTAQNNKVFPEGLITEKGSYYLCIYTMESLGTSHGLSINGIGGSSLEKVDFESLSMDEKLFAKLLELTIPKFKSYGMAEPKTIYSGDLMNSQANTTEMAKDNPRAPYIIVIMIGSFDKVRKKLKKNIEITLEDFMCQTLVASSTNNNNKSNYQVMGPKPLDQVLDQFSKETSGLSYSPEKNSKETNEAVSEEDFTDVVMADLLYRNDEIKDVFIPKEELKKNTLIVICPLYKPVFVDMGKKSLNNSLKASAKEYERDTLYWLKRLNTIMESYPYPYKVMLIDDYEKIENREEFPYILVTRAKLYNKTKVGSANSNGFSDTRTSLTALYHYVLMDTRNYTLYYGSPELAYRQSSRYGIALSGTLKLLKEHYKWE